ncbi:MAG: hypothetical protein KDF49_09425, partial [Nitrosomonas sp.]|nr:hypothetical protein [Nitrosomonas sp.]
IVYYYENTITQQPNEMRLHLNIRLLFQQIVTTMCEIYAENLTLCKHGELVVCGRQYIKQP